MWCPAPFVGDVVSGFSRTVEIVPVYSRLMSRFSVVIVLLTLAPSGAAQDAARAGGAVVQVKPQARPGGAPPWSKGILPISPESYYHAIECGKQGGADPPCVFWDTGLCRNEDFTLAMYTPYKQVAYEVWTAVQNKKPAPTPSYPAAQQTRVTIAATPARGAKNVLKNLVVRRGSAAAAPVDRSVTGGGGRFTFDFPAFAATGGLTLEMVGTERTISCSIDQTTLKTFR
jgi:hypothetical protein